MPPKKVFVLLYTSKLAGPLIVTVPRLLSTFSRYTVPLMFISPALAIVNGRQIKEPPDQLKEPLIITELDRLMAPLVTLTTSLEPGTPTGDQLFGVNQSLEAEPV